MTKKIISCTIFICLFLTSSSLWATPFANLVYNEINLGGGMYQYNYSISNISDSSEALYGLALTFDHAAPINGRPLPIGWYDGLWNGIQINDSLSAFTIDPVSDIAAGNSLSGFRFTTDFQAGDVDFRAFFENNSGEIFETSGTTSARVPEPCTLLLLGGGLSAIGLFRNKIRKNLK